MKSRYNEAFQQPSLEQMPNNRDNAHPQHSKSDDDESNKNISTEYQEIQLRTLTKWINVQLNKVGDQIMHIEYDLKDGEKLLKLISVVADTTGLKPEKGKMRIHQLSNVARALSFLQEQWGKDSLPAIANESIVNGDIKSTLAIAFFIMLKYQIHPILLNKNSPCPPSPGDSRSKPTAEAKMILLYWVRYQLNDYVSSHIISDIHDFSRSWRSGLAFCLLLHRYDPDLVPTLFMHLTQQSLTKNMWYTLLTLAFDVAQDQLNIPRYLDPEDLLVELPHEPSVMMYISELYNVMKHHNHDTKREKRLNDISIFKTMDDQQTFYDLSSDSSTRGDNEDVYGPLELIHHGKSKDIVPRNNSGEPIHPLDGTLEMADSFEHALSQFSDPDVDLQSACELFRRGVMFSQITFAIREEMDLIQHLMKTSPVTNEFVHNLGQRIYMINTALEGVRDEYAISSDVRFIQCMNKIETQYETVLHWINRVRIWYSEAEITRDWINKRIQFMEEMEEFDPFESNIDSLTAMELYQAHDLIQREIDEFDGVAQLQTHVLTNTDDELTPADTCTIEITSTTLNLLSRLTQLVNNRSHLIQLLLLRIQWQDLFTNCIEWIANTDKQMDNFLRENARWSETTHDDNEDVIATLISLESQISDFDHGSYATVLEAYQELRKIYNKKLPENLEISQIGLEHAFEDLMKRSSFSRKVVEQRLLMLGTVEKFKELRQVGETLRLMDDIEDEDIFADRVQLFKEESALLITNASTYIPYPVVPEMSTAIGASDAHDTEITNANIKSTISTYSMALALIADVLEQLLMSRYQVTSLQSRSKEALATMTRLKNWMDERVELLGKTYIDTLLYNSSTPNMDPVPVSTSDELYRLEKERDIIVQKLSQMENDELAKCYITVHELEKDIDVSNAVSIDRNTLVSCVESLESSHDDLKKQLSHRGLQLDALKKHHVWETQSSKASNHFQTIARKLFDFSIKKAMYNPNTENNDKPSYQGDRDLNQSLHFLQERVAELEERFLSPLKTAYLQLKESHRALGGDVPDVISSRQDDAVLKYNGLKQFSLYTADLVTQRASITEFLFRVQDASKEGEKIKDAFSKRTRLIMVNDSQTSLSERAVMFKREIKSIWEDCGKNMLYPIYNDAWHQQQRQHSITGINVQIKTMLHDNMKGLSSLESAIDQCIESYNNANQMKQLVTQYEQEASELELWIDAQMELLKSQYFDVSAEILFPQGVNISDLKQIQNDMLLHADQFENDKVKGLHDLIVQFFDDTNDQVVNVSPAANKFAHMMNQLSQLKQGLNDQSIALDAASKRLEWEKQLKIGMLSLEAMSEQVHRFNCKKNQVVNQDDLNIDQVQDLENDLSSLIQQKNNFETTILPDIQLSYSNFIEYFPKLSRPMATPDHLELRMESLNGLNSRLQENIDNKSHELVLVKQRLNWESLVSQSLAYLLNQEKRVENFIEEKARWRIDKIFDKSEEATLVQEWSNLANDFKNYESSVLAPLRKTYNYLVSEMAMYYAAQPSAKKMEHVQMAQDAANNHLEFSNKVVDQRCIVSAFILENSQLAQSAELIHQGLASIDLSSGDMISVLENHSQKLETWKISAKNVQNTNIPFPIRTPSNKKDEAANSSVRKTVDSYNSRLDELVSTLQQVLESKERVYRRKLSLHYYRKQVNTTESWIDSQNLVLVSISKIETDVEKLKEIVGQINHIEKILLSNDNVFESLVSVYNKCLMAFQDSLPTVEEDGQQLLVDEFENFVQPTQDRLCQVWDTLLQETTIARKTNQIRLIEMKVLHWSNSLNGLENTVGSIDEKSGSIDQLNQLLNELDYLKNQEYSILKSDIKTYSELFDKKQIININELLEDGLAVVEKLNDMLFSLKIKVQLHKLIEAFSNEVTTLQCTIQEQTMVVVTIYKDHNALVVESTFSGHQSHYQTLTNKYNCAAESIKNMKVALKNVAEKYQSIMEQDGDFISEEYIKMNNSWDDLLCEQSNLTSLVSRMSKWIPFFELLSRVRSDITSTETKIVSDSNFYSLDISKIRSLLCVDLVNIGVTLLRDYVNYKPFEEERVSLLERLKSVENDIKERKKQQEKLSLVQHLEEKINSLCVIVNEQFTVAENYCERFCLTASIDQCEKKSGFCRKVINDNSLVVSSCQQEICSLQENYCSKLRTQFNWSEPEVCHLFNPLDQAMTKLTSFTFTEQQHVDFAVKSQQYLISQSNVSSMIEKYIDTIDGIEPSEEISTSLERKFETLQEAVQNSELLYQDLLQYAFKCQQNCFSIALKSIDVRQKKTVDLLNSAKEMLKKVTQDIDNIVKQQKIVTKLTSILKFVNEMTGKVEVFDGHKKSTENELNEICFQFYQSLDKKQVSVNLLIAEAAPIKSFKSLNDKILSSIANLDSIIQLKKKEFGKKEDTSEFSRILSAFEKHIASLALIIEEASPKHSNIINNKFVKSDLQLLLKTLVKEFKHHKQIINDIVDDAVIESKKRFLVGNHQVTEKLEKMKKRWAKTQSAASAREKELKTCIKQLDHEFFTKLAMAKTTNSSSPIIQNSPRPQLSTTRRKLYIPNPNNELDVKLSQIINSSPYKITVTVVPNEIGKYWFGDENPRLVYCRILPSKLVMVRVGGGWVELSKFLREHGFTDNSCSRPDSVNENKEPYQETYLKSMPPVNRITIRGGGSVHNSSSSMRRSSSKMSLSSPKSPLPGYVDGDRFVSIDEEGNQYFVKMKKASDDAKTPTISKKKH